MIALNDQQVETLLRLAAAVPPSRRKEFADALALELAALDGRVHSARDDSQQPS
jgi:hypothetical protein